MRHYLHKAVVSQAYLKTPSHTFGVLNLKYKLCQHKSQELVKNWKYPRNSLSCNQIISFCKYTVAG